MYYEKNVAMLKSVHSSFEIPIVFSVKAVMPDKTGWKLGRSL